MHSRPSSAAPRETAVDIFSFTDFRGYLGARFAEQKSRNAGWSYAAWARQLGLKDSSSIIKVIRGQRHPGATIVARLVRGMRLGDDEARYFRALVALDAKSDRADELIANLRTPRPARARVPSADRRILPLQQFQAMSTWYHMAIRELVGLAEFREHPDWICARLRFAVTPAQVQMAIRTLLDLGLLRREAGSGRLAIAVPEYRTESDVPSEAIKRFHEASLRNAAAAVREVPVELRQFRSLTLPTRADKLARARELIVEFTARFEAEMDCESATDIAQLQIQFYPLTRKAGPT